MEKTIIITSTLREKFKAAWERRQVLFFSAPCGCGKTVIASALLEGRVFCVWDAMDAIEQELPLVHNYEAVILDNIHVLKNPALQEQLCQTVRANPEVHFLMLSRGAVPNWLVGFRYEPRMQVFESQDLMLDRESSEMLLNLSDVFPSPGEMADIQKAARGYPMAMRILCHLMRDGRHYDKSVDGDARRELFTYFETNVYRRFSPATRRLLLDLASFETFDVEFAQIITGNSRAGELMGELQKDTSMFLYSDVQHCRFWPIFRQFLLWQQEREYSVEERRQIFSRAALYYELHDDYANALDCYNRSGDYRKLSELLIKNSELHPSLAHYDEMESYYRALPHEEILASPVLIAGMSMLCSICMDYEGSEAWYQELEQYKVRINRFDPEYKAVRGRLAYLDIALPQRSVNKIPDMLPALKDLLLNHEIEIPEFSVTSRLPSIMNGGKDFCEWSKKDDSLYQWARLPVSVLLKRDGVKLPECAIAESKFEKGEDVTGRLLDLMGHLDVIQKKGTPDIEFALIGLLVRLRIDQGEAGRAREHLEALRERFQRPDCLRFLPNLDAMLCRVAMYEGDEDTVDQWYKEKAPRDFQKLRVMLRYQYMTRVMVEIIYGDHQEAMLAMAPLRTYFTACHRVMDLLCLDLLTAVCQFRAGDGDWKTPLCHALDTCLEYQFIRPVSQYGAAVLPLLTDCGWTGDAAFLKRLITAARMQAAQYPDFLRYRGALEEPLSAAEKKVLRLLCYHKSNAEIGETLGISVATVKTHVSRIMRKLDVENRGAVKDAAVKLHLF